MEIAAALNPFTGQWRYRAVWNALMASYRFRTLDAAQQEAVLVCVRTRLPNFTCYTLAEVLKRRGVVVFLNCVALGLADRGYAPGLGHENWLPVTNPFVECYGAECALADVKALLEGEYGVVFDVNFDEFTKAVRVFNR
jgi:hypothetical protein